MSLSEIKIPKFSYFANQMAEVYTQIDIDDSQLAEYELQLLTLETDQKILKIFQKYISQCEKSFSEITQMQNVDMQDRFLLKLNGKINQVLRDFGDPDLKSLQIKIEDLLHKKFHSGSALITSKTETSEKSFSWTEVKSQMIKKTISPEMIDAISFTIYYQESILFPHKEKAKKFLNQLYYFVQHEIAEAEEKSCTFSTWATIAHRTYLKGGTNSSYNIIQGCDTYECEMNYNNWTKEKNPSKEYLYLKALFDPKKGFESLQKYGEKYRFQNSIPFLVLDRDQSHSEKAKELNTKITGLIEAIQKAKEKKLFSL